MEKTRIQKIIADSGYCSRRKAESLIAAGHVQCNGRPVKLGDKAGGRDLITVNGERIALPKKKQKLYLRLPDMTGETFERMKNLLEIFSGSTPVLLYLTEKKQTVRAPIFFLPDSAVEPIEEFTMFSASFTISVSSAKGRSLSLFIMKYASSK